MAPLATFAILSPLMTAFIFPETEDYIAFFATFAFGVVFLGLATAVLRKGEEPFSQLSQCLLLGIYVTAGFVSLVLLRRMAGGEYIFGLVLVASWVTDTMAYFTGRVLGKHKLCPKISPKKTIEGAIGGTVFCALAFLLYGFIVEKAFGKTANYGMLFLFGAILSIVSQFGDLVLSYIKREHGIKDYGNIMPGHGGVLDRFDSVIAVAPFLLLFCGFASAFSFFY